MEDLRSSTDLTDLLNQETTLAAFEFMKKNSNNGWLKASLGKEDKTKTQLAVHAVTMKFLPAVHKAGDITMGPSRNQFNKVMQEAFGLTSFDVRRHVETKDLVAKSAQLWGSGGTTTLGSEDDVKELQHVRKVLAQLGFHSIDEVADKLHEYAADASTLKADSEDGAETL